MEDSWLLINPRGAARLSRPLSHPEAVRSIAPSETVLVAECAEALDKLFLQTGKVTLFLAGHPEHPCWRGCPGLLRAVLTLLVCSSLTLSPRLLDLQYNDAGPVTTQVDRLYARVICILHN